MGVGVSLCGLGFVRWWVGGSVRWRREELGVWITDDEVFMKRDMNLAPLLAEWPVSACAVERHV